MEVVNSKYFWKLPVLKLEVCWKRNGCNALTMLVIVKVEIVHVDTDYLK